MQEPKRVAVTGILTAGHKGTAVEVSFDPATELGACEVVLWPGRRGFPVEVSLNGVRFRSAIVSRMKRHFVLVDESLARRAGSRVGSIVNLMLWADPAHESRVEGHVQVTTGSRAGSTGKATRTQRKPGATKASGRARRRTKG